MHYHLHRHHRKFFIIKLLLLQWKTNITCYQYKFFYCRFSQVHSRLLDDLFHGTVYVSTIYDAVKHYPQLKNNSARICVIFTQLTCYQHSICSQLTIRGHVNSFMHIWGTHWSNGVSIFFKWNFRPQLTKQLTDKALTSYNHWQSAKLRT